VVAPLAGDRDGDGATSLFAGSDVDDRNPAVHPFATEIPVNGVDENCFGGDGATTAREPATPVATEPTSYDFVLVALDTLRASRMSVYGYDRPTTPRIAEYAARGRFFTNAYSAGSNTGLTFATMQRATTRAAVFGKARPTLFGSLAAAGYVTAQVNASSDSRWLAPRTWRRYRKVIMTGITNVTHQEEAGRWDADRVTDEAIRYIDALPPGARHATWVHYLDQHEPRRKFEPYDYGDSASDVYDSTVAFADHEVGRLLDYLRDSGRLDRTVVVLMSDHGESFDEHGMNEHGNRPYLEQVRVPTIVWAPGAAPARVDVPVTTTDIAPTVLDALGLPPLANAEGRSLLGDLPARAVFAETPANLPQPSFFSYAVTDGSWRLIWDVRGNTLELYDTASDPGELHNLADAEPERMASMKSLLARWLDSTEAVRQFGKHDAGGE
jgi:arylsulfatase A-like enzyme